MLKRRLLIVACFVSLTGAASHGATNGPAIAILRTSDMTVTACRVASDQIRVRRVYAPPDKNALGTICRMKDRRLERELWAQINTNSHPTDEEVDQLPAVISGPLPVMAIDTTNNTVEVPSVWENRNWKKHLIEFGPEATPTDTFSFNSERHFREAWKDGDEIYAVVGTSQPPSYHHIHVRKGKILGTVITYWF